MVRVSIEVEHPGLPHDKEWRHEKEVHNETELVSHCVNADLVERPEMLEKEAIRKVKDEESEVRKCQRPAICQYLTQVGEAESDSDLPESPSGERDQLNSPH